MKKILSLFFAASFLIQTASAQLEFTIREETRPMTRGSFNALTIELPGTDIKEIQKSWRKFSGDYKAKTSFDKKSGELFTDNATIKEMSENTVDIHAKVEQTTTGTQLSVWFNLGGAYLSSAQFSDKYPAGEKMLKDFARSISGDLLEAEIKAQEKLLGNLEDDLKKLEKEKSSLEKEIKNQEENIKKAQEAIVKAQEGLGENSKNQGTKNQEISTQQKTVEDLKAELKALKKK